MASAPSSPKASGHCVWPSEILDEIFAYTPRSTLAVCLRTSRQLFEPAGRALYRNVRIDGTMMIQFFRGAPLGVGAEDDLRNCSILAGQDLPNCHFLEDRDHCDRLPACVVPYELTQPSAVEPRPTKDTRRREQDASAHPTVTKRRRADESGRAIEEGHGSNGDGAACSISDDARRTDTPVNLKAELLKHVRVLTLATHHLCQCDVYAPVAARLLHNLDTLRIAPSIEPMPPLDHELAYLCDSVAYGGECRFLTSLTFRKLVFRNLDDRGLNIIEPPAGKWTPNVEEVVYFLPRNGQHYDCEFGASLHNLNQVFAAARTVKFVYISKWEGWDNTADLSRDIFCPRLRPQPSDIQSPFVYRDLDRQLVVVGLECIDFQTGEDALLDLFRGFCPDEQDLSRERVLQIVKDEICTPRLYTISAHGTYDRSGTVDVDGPVSFVNIAKYLVDDPAASIEVGDHFDIFLALELFNSSRPMGTDWLM